MDQRADYIRQDIESTRAALDSKLDSLESKARETFDLKHQVSERPLMAIGAAAAVGYVLGSLGSSEPEQRWQGQPTTTEHSQHAFAAQQPGAASSSNRSGGDRFLAQFDDEIDMLKTAAITTLTNFLHDMIKEYVPALGQQLDQNQQNGNTHSKSAGVSRYGNERPTRPAAEADSETLNDLLTGATPAATTARERSIGTDTTRY